MVAYPDRKLLTAVIGVERARAVGAGAGWSLQGDRPPSGNVHEHELVWTVPGVDGSIHFWHDTIAGFDYVVRGPGDAERMETEIERCFEIVSDDEIVDGLTSAEPLDRGWAVLALALSAARVHEEALELLVRERLQDDDRAVRLDAILAAGYLNDRRWIPLLEIVAETDVDPEVAGEAGRIARGLQVHAPE